MFRPTLATAGSSLHGRRLGSSGSSFQARNTPFRPPYTQHTHLVSICHMATMIHCATRHHPKSNHELEPPSSIWSLPWPHKTLPNQETSSSTIMRYLVLAVRTRRVVSCLQFKPRPTGPTGPAGSASWRHLTAMPMVSHDANQFSGLQTDPHHIRLRCVRLKYGLIRYFIRHIGTPSPTQHEHSTSQFTWSAGSASWRHFTTMSIASRQPNWWRPDAPTCSAHMCVCVCVCVRARVCGSALLL